MGKNKKAFTLAETLITLTILGVVAAITIPALINRYKEASYRTKVKKAMEVYEEALNHMVIENDIKNNQVLKDEFNYHCNKSREYFKIAENDNENECRFKTADGVWWDISDIENPIIILDKNIRGNDRADFIEDYAKNLEDENGKKIYAYAMTGRIDDKTGILRINDKGYEDNEQYEDYPLYLAKLYSFVNNTEDLDLKYAKACPNACDVMSYLGGGSSGCSSCSFSTNVWGKEGTALFDENGNLYKANYTLPSAEIDGETITYKGVLNGNLSYKINGYYSDGTKQSVEKCSQIDLNTGNCGGYWDSTFYYKNGKVKRSVKENESGSCIKYYNEDGSFDHQDGNACED